MRLLVGFTQSFTVLLFLQLINYLLRDLSTAPQNKVTIVSKRHSGNLLAGIQKNSLDTGLRRYDELTVDSYLC